MEVVAWIAGRVRVQVCAWMRWLLPAAVALSGCSVAPTAPQVEWRKGERAQAAGPAHESCELHLAAHLAAGDSDPLLEEEAEEHQRLVEQALAHRARTVELGTRLRAQEGPLSGADLKTLSEGVVASLELRETLLRVAHRHECWLDAPPERLAAQPPRHRLEAVLLSLSAALVLYDNYLLGVSLFENDPRLRRALNGADAGYGLGRENLNGVAQEYYSAENRNRVREGIRFYERELPTLPGSEREKSPMRYLSALIEQSPSYRITRDGSPGDALGRGVRLLELITGDHLAELTSSGVNLFSMLFGNTVGLVETRKGKLYRDAAVHTEVSAHLRAGDILLEKTPFRLTDALIPGHWGHAALWIGTEPELKALGIWEHPVVARHHREIRAGAAVVEALRPGVQLNPLDHFLNIDDLAVLRGRGLDDAARAEVVVEGLRQIGKEYDFNFDVETADRIVCSELIYLTYGHIEWPTRRTLGRSTISPDNIAVKALNGGPLEAVLLYHDGRHVTQGLEPRLAALLEGEMPLASADTALPP